MSTAVAKSATTHKESMLAEWETGSVILARGYYDAAKRDARWNDIITTAVIASTAIAGSTIFATLGSSPRQGWRIVAGVVSLLATLLAAEQKYLRLEERATKQQQAGRSHQALRQECEMLLARLQDGLTVTDEQIDSMRTRRDEIEKTAPTIPDAIYRRVKEDVLKCKECPKYDIGGEPDDNV